MLSFPLLINNSITIGLRFPLLIVSAIISSKTINTLQFVSGLHSLISLLTTANYLNIQEKPVNLSDF